VTTSAQAISSPLLTLHPSPGRSFGLLDRVRPRPPRACATATAADIQRHGILGPGAKEISAAERAAQHRYVQSLAVGLILERLFSLLGRIWSAIWLTWLATDTTVGTLSARYRLPPPLSGRYQIDLSRCRADIPEAVGLIPPTTSHCRPDTGSSPIDLGHYPADTVDFISSIEALSGRHDFLPTPLWHCRDAVGPLSVTPLAVGPIPDRPLSLSARYCGFYQLDWSAIGPTWFSTDATVGPIPPTTSHCRPDTGSTSVTIRPILWILSAQLKRYRADMTFY